jgi:hypothetical protein
LGHVQIRPHIKNLDRSRIALFTIKEGSQTGTGLEQPPHKKVGESNWDMSTTAPLQKRRGVKLGQVQTRPHTKKGVKLGQLQNSPLTKQEGSQTGTAPELGQVKNSLLTKQEGSQTGTGPEQTFHKKRGESNWDRSRTSPTKKEGG